MPLNKETKPNNRSGSQSTWNFNGNVEIGHTP